MPYPRPIFGSPHHRPRIVRICLLMALSTALAMALSIADPHTAFAAVPPITLGSAASFAVLANSAVNNTNQTTITGDLGVSPGSTVTGFPPGTVSGSVHAGDSTAAAARSDAVSAYNDAASRTPVVTAAAELGSTTKTPGVYTPGGGAFQINGTLTLDAQEDPNALFVFTAGSLTTANVSNISLINGAQASNVFWQITGSASLGGLSTFRGNLLASSFVTVNSGAFVFGRTFSLNGSVTTVGGTTGPATAISLPNNPATSTALTTSANPVQEGQSVTYTATVSPASSPLIPQGPVAFKDGATVLGTVNLNSSGAATFTTSSLAPGRHPITAAYLGGDVSSGEGIVHFAPSISPQITEIVTASLWDNSAVPAVASAADGRAVVVGVKFQATANGTVRGIRFYKGALNTGTHTVSLWTSGGTLLASTVATIETASGWQQVNFSTPVAITAGTTYIASYHTTSGHFSYTTGYFSSQYTNDPLLAPADGGPQGGNGVYVYGSTNAFPTSTWQSANYWVDPVFVPAASLWPNSTVPATASSADTAPVVVGVKFQATADGVIEGIRFYKGALNTGPHTVSLWTLGGTQLASTTSSGETASGWQQVNFPTPVAISANTTYVASYLTTSGHYSQDTSYFTSQYTNAALIAPVDGQFGGNGVYVYSATNAFPTNTFQSSNYWVDVVYTAS
ncbi:DUF4082 domain-containing protein [Sphaerisporangium fuscum]|uniref:DUF4082 domain-containing protein n=1 Tax=Sphaerisporangium fuscum TaxID=2835868 RepID=UPI001BDD24CF|nr:DUF4082 domain-containing protein [Sphaerisporangium fuscum]